MKGFNEDSVKNIHNLNFSTFPVAGFKVESKKNNINTETFRDSHNFSKEKILLNAFKAHSQGKLQEALKYYESFLERGFSDSRVFSNLGVINYQLGNIDKAIKLYKKSISLFPNSPKAYSNLGIILNHIGNTKDAEYFCRKSIMINPNLASSHYNLSVVLISSDKLIEAIKSLKTSINLDPTFYQAYNNLGNIFRNLGNLKEAESHIRNAINVKPDLAISYYNLAGLLKDMGRIEEAKRSFSKSCKLNSGLVQSFYELALIHSYENNYELAIKYLKKHKNSDACQSLLLSCLLSLDREEDFQALYKTMYNKGVCNAEIGGIVQHANLIYEKKNKSTFCNEAISYVFVDEINEDLFPQNYVNQLISYFKSQKIKMRNQPILSGGVQTAGNLFSLDYDFITSIKKNIEDKIEIYKKRFKGSNQGFINDWPREYELRAWMIGMKNGGFLKPHNHEYGWITGSFYLQVPKLINNDEANIAFTYQGPRFPKKNDKFNLIKQRIKERDICIFPSSLFHQTIPFQSEEERISFVFDLVQK